MKPYTVLERRHPRCCFRQTGLGTYQYIRECCPHVAGPWRRMQIAKPAYTMLIDFPLTDGCLMRALYSSGRRAGWRRTASLPRCRIGRDSRVCNFECTAWLPLLRAWAASRVTDDLRPVSSVDAAIVSQIVVTLFSGRC